MTTLAAAVRLPDVTTDLDELLRQVAQRDADAFATFYDRTRARVFGMVTRVLRDPGYSEETTQEIYLQVWRTADSYDPAAGSPLASVRSRSTRSYRLLLSSSSSWSLSGSWGSKSSPSFRTCKLQQKV